MKKLFVLLLALTVLAGAVFAQATVNGYVRSVGTYDAKADTFKIANRLRLNLGWTAPDKNVMFAGRWQLDGTSTYAAPNYMYGKIKLADGMLAISGGKLNNYDYDISTSLSEYYIGNVANGGSFPGTSGMLVQVMPISALNIGLIITPDGGPLAAKQFGVNAKFDIEGIGSVIVASKFADPFEDSFLSGAFKFTMVKDLSVAVGYKMNDAAKDYVFGVIDYATGPVTLQVAPQYKITDEKFYIEGAAKYKVSDALAFLASVSYQDDVFFALETLYTVGKGLLQLNLVYDGATEAFKISPVVKVSF